MFACLFGCVGFSQMCWEPNQVLEVTAFGSKPYEPRDILGLFLYVEKSP